ncbi:MAG: DUF4230 domain-containing protein [Candidatus Magasanikbacteria bacterium]|nr:DUF4230 domain-containing protein [Candidatus Magasanikbacteria bacterium]NCS72115.1 DUF4230 domain-containing protein [Candidatus Magasanikbacteria bacterium]
MIKRYLFLAFALILFGSGLFVGYKVFHTPAEAAQQITGETILAALKSEGFLVTQTYIFHEQVEIDKSTGSTFKDLFWKQNITAAANMKVSAGTNLSHLEETDVLVTKDKVEVTIPNIETYGVEILGDITLNNEQGILKKLFNSEDGYNEAIKQLKDQALSAVQTEELRQEARESAQKEVQKIIELTNNTNKTVIVHIK